MARAASNPPWAENDARLVLEDGSVWHGVAFGARASAVGEAVFNTSLTGYQEILTDPSYKGQFVVFTVPHIGNVGINPGESEKVARALLGLNDEDLIGQCRRFFLRRELEPSYHASRRVPESCRARFALSPL